MFRYRTLLGALAVLSALGASSARYDLSHDWSDAVNPFGAWRLLKNQSALFTINQAEYGMYGPGQHAWADEPFPSNSHVPLWWKLSYPSSNTLDFHLGDIYAHGAEIDRTGSNFTSAVWTSPVSGTVNIGGLAWTTWVSGRTQTWRLMKNRVTLSEMTMTGDGSNRFDNAVSLANGSGGPGALMQSVVPGDTIELAIVTVSVSGNVGDMWGIRFSIETPDELPTISGTVTLEDRLSSPAGTILSWQVLRWDNGALAESGQTALDADGRYRYELPLSLPEGNYDLWVKTPQALAMVRKGVALERFHETGVDYSLANGDCDDDNAVTVFDYNILSDAFDAIEGDSNWDVRADLDGDGAVTVFDYSILSTNFDRSGD